MLHVTDHLGSVVAVVRGGDGGRCTRRWNTTFYELKRNGKDVNPNHVRSVFEYETIVDPEYGNITYPIWGNTNIVLENWIKNCRDYGLI